NLDYHVRRVRVPEPGTLRQVFDLAEVDMQSPLDISRPLWTATLVEGLRDGRAATMLHLSHAVTDGVGGVEMFASIYDFERDPPPGKEPPLPIPPDLTPNDLMWEGVGRLPRSVVCCWRWLSGVAVRAVGQPLRDPRATVECVLDCPASSAVLVTPVAAASLIRCGRSRVSRTGAID